MKTHVVAIIKKRIEIRDSRYSEYISSILRAFSDNLIPNIAKLFVAIKNRMQFLFKKYLFLGLHFLMIGLTFKRVGGGSRNGRIKGAQKSDEKFIEEWQRSGCALFCRQ